MTSSGGETAKDPLGWTVDTLLAHIQAVLDERDRRYEQRFEAQLAALNAALATTREEVKQTAQAVESRFQSVNEFRQTLSDQTQTFLPRPEYYTAHRALEEKVADSGAAIRSAHSRLDLITGKSSGMSQSWMILVGAIGLIATIIAIYSALSK